jgi:peptidoglycan hydrolase CwlO-like protein
VTLIGTSTLIFPFNHKVVYANADLMEKKEDIQNERSGIQSNIQKKESEILKLEEEQKKFDIEIERLDMQATETNKKIRQRQGEIDNINKKIEELKIQIEEVKERIKERNLLLEGRVRSLQVSGGVVSYLQVILGSQDFSDLISRISAVSTIVNADKEIISAHEIDIEILDQSEETLNTELYKLKTTLNELELLKKQVSTQINEKSKLLAQVNVDHEQAESALYDLEDEEAFLTEQEVIIQKEMERQQKLKEQSKQKEAEVAAASKKSNTSTSSTSEAVQTSSASRSLEPEQASSIPSASESKQTSSKSSPSKSEQASNETSAPTASSSFIWPAQGTFTSGYGQRWGKLHGGIDIANSAANVPVIASEAGTVIRSYYSSSYGNAVFISHNINGKVYTTVYAHLDSRLVSSGQTVSKRQQIGYMGNTGQSTGKHLHFEIHDGAWKNPVDPMSYLK